MTHRSQTNRINDVVDDDDWLMETLSPYKLKSNYVALMPKQSVKHMSLEAKEKEEEEDEAIQSLIKSNAGCWLFQPKRKLRKWRYSFEGDEKVDKENLEINKNK